MRYRKLSPTGDYTFGAGQANFYINNRECVGQMILTRLRLLTQEWFLNLSSGTPYATQVFGTTTLSTYDAAIRARILGTSGVISITSYASSLSPGRKLSVQAAISTIFGTVNIDAVL